MMRSAFNKKMSKYILFVFMLFISCEIVAQNVSPEAQDAELSRKVDSILIKLTATGITAERRQDLIRFGYLIQNKGFIHGEQNEYEKSLKLIDEALGIWTAIKDTLKEANNRKFRGLLLGQLKRFPEAKAEIDYAVKLFSVKKNNSGVAVSQFDLSKVYEVENKLDSALIYSRLASNYWNFTTDTGRILINNNQNINLLIKLKEFEKALLIQEKSVKLLIKANLYWQGVIDFYFLSYSLYSDLDNKKEVENFQKRYTEELTRLQQDGIIRAKSIYEIVDI